MARIKPKRHNIRVDMTAMTDVSFLLLTFFILTAQFAKPDVEKITTPSSISQTLLPDGGIIQVLSSPDGRFFFQPADNGTEKMQVLEAMGQKYGQSFTDAEKAAFTKVQAVGVPINQMKSYLALSDDQKKSFKAPGVPQDSLNTQLVDWIKLSRTVNPDYKLAVKGDTNTKYENVKRLFEGLRDNDILQFMLITNQEAGNQN